MIELFFISCFVALILLIWLHSEAFIEYASFFHGQKFFYIDDFREKQKKDLTLDWIAYLQKYHKNFFIRLITCPLCSSVWLTLILCYSLNNLFLFPIANILALVIYKLVAKLLES